MGLTLSEGIWLSMGNNAESAMAKRATSNTPNITIVFLLSKSQMPGAWTKDALKSAWSFNSSEVFGKIPGRIAFMSLSN